MTEDAETSGVNREKGRKWNVQSRAVNRDEDTGHGDKRGSQTLIKLFFGSNLVRQIRKLHHAPR